MKKPDTNRLRRILKAIFWVRPPFLAALFLTLVFILGPIAFVYVGFGFMDRRGIILHNATDSDITQIHLKFYNVSVNARGRTFELDSLPSGETIDWPTGLLSDSVRLRYTCKGESYITKGSFYDGPIGWPGHVIIFDSESEVDIRTPCYEALEAPGLRCAAHDCQFCKRR